MKKTVLLLLLILAIPALAAPDSLETRPSPYAMSERYLFTPSVEGAEGLRVNPAILGLGHGMNGRFSVFTQGPNFFNTWDNFREFDFSLQLSGLGLGWRYFTDPFTNKSFNQWTAGLGFGSRSFSMGFSRDFYAGELSNSATWNLGLLIRPANWFSLSYALRNINQPTIGGIQHNQTDIFGLALRPFDGREYLTLAADYYTPNGEAWKHGTLRVGGSAKPVEGLTLTAAYQKNFNDILNANLPFRQAFSIGVNFEYGYSAQEFAGILDSDGSPSGLIIANRFTAEKFDFFSLFGTGPQSIAELRIGGQLTENPKPDFFGLNSQPSVHTYINALDRAAEDKQIGGILLSISGISGGGFTELSATLQELGAAIQRARQAGKYIVAYFPQGAGAAELYLGSYAELLVMPKEATVSSYGIDISLLRMKKFFEKYGIDWDVNAAGQYKTTFHTFWTDSSTAEQRQEIDDILQSQYSQLISRIEQARNIRLTEEQRNMLSGIVTAERAAEMKIIDYTGFYDRAKREMAAKLMGRSDDEYFTMGLLSIRRWNGNWSTPPKIAVVPVEGTITSGQSQGGSDLPFFGSAPTTGSETFVQQMRSAVQRPDVKAIIVRVNSGGGSALASDEMHNAITKAAEHKPVIISFGNVAASGGYYLAVAGKKIFTNPATITGSIGVISAKPVVARLLDTLRINEETYKVGEHTDMSSAYRRYTPEERRMVDEYVNSTYQEFLRKVAQGRNMSVSEVENLAGGRVYTGEQAQQKKLVDNFGGLYDAVREAQSQSGLDERYAVEFYASGRSLTLENMILETALNELLAKLGIGVSETYELR